jgi:large subunit ribosomal protein L15
MRQDQIKPPKGAKKPRKRLGRGNGSGHGNFSGRGMKGQNSRSGGGVRPGFEGGQLPLIKRLPSMRGFTNIFRKEYAPVNLDSLSKFPENSEVTPELMVKTGLVKNPRTLIKILGRGNLNIPLVVQAHKFSSSAINKIEAAGGSVKEIQ